MSWFEVRIGWKWSHGEEREEYIVKARNEKHAREKVLEIHDWLEWRDKIEVCPFNHVYDNGVIYKGRYHYDVFDR